MPQEGLEPSRVSPPRFECGASANSTTKAHKTYAEAFAVLQLLSSDYRRCGSFTRHPLIDALSPSDMLTINLVPHRGIEPRTHGFSDHRSTTELERDKTLSSLLLDFDSVSQIRKFVKNYFKLFFKVPNLVTISTSNPTLLNLNFNSF